MKKRFEMRGEAQKMRTAQIMIKDTKARYQIKKYESKDGNKRVDAWIVTAIHCIGSMRMY